MDVLTLLNQLESLDQVPQKLSELTESQLSKLSESMDYYLLVYPQGTGDDDLEELLEVLSEYFYPEDEE